MKLAALILMLSATLAQAETHEVKMLNRNDEGPMIYEPQHLTIAPGDTVRFLPTQSGHNAATIDGMIPDGAEAWKSKINEEFEVTLTVPGRYGIKCSPHYAMGMVMVIDVGEDAEAEIPANVPARAKQRFDAILGQKP
ncbi:pseudoazurin [Paracoccus sp. p4-l81]|uniref:pseudoazurin n=1 Tax=unclassified Paracoccus (in: a-proteobacteria) TaxID=2688777 RepID=UPI0035B7E61C